MDNTLNNELTSIKDLLNENKLPLCETYVKENVTIRTLLLGVVTNPKNEELLQNYFISEYPEQEFSIIPEHSLWSYSYYTPPRLLEFLNLILEYRLRHDMLRLFSYEELINYQKASHVDQSRIESDLIHKKWLKSKYSPEKISKFFKLIDKEGQRIFSSDGTEQHYIFPENSIAYENLVVVTDSKELKMHRKYFDRLKGAINWKSAEVRVIKKAENGKFNVLLIEQPNIKCRII